MKAQGALSGIRVLDLSSAIAMPFCAFTLADLGAEVIKVESHTRINDRVWGALLTGIFPENEPGDEYWEESANFHTLHRNKAGISLDLKKPQAVEIVKRLVAMTDVLIENNRPGVMERLGLGYSVLFGIKPDLIILSNTGFGQTGPWKHYPGLASMMEPLIGLALASGYEDGDPERIGNAYIDYLSAWNGLAAILAALHYRRRTGKGQHIDQSMFQIGMHTVVEPLLDYQLRGTETKQLGLSHRWMAPHSAYPCQGNDRWIAIAGRSDAEWERLCGIMGEPTWCRDEKFRDTLGRHEHRQEIDAHLATWTADHDAYALMRTLQAAGIPAGVVQNPMDLVLDPQLAERGYWHMVDHSAAAPQVGRRPIMGLPYTLSETPPQVEKASPGLGEDNARILHDLLGMSASDIAALEAEGVISDRPDPSQARGKPDTLPLPEQKDLGVIRDYDPDYQTHIAEVLDSPARTRS
jgi:crotonobetainyl-CoA:carnitine CoA-transferase CaiB-like acyl-CoA transferase